MKEGTIQLLVKCRTDGSTAFCITTEEGKAFDFHFTSKKEEACGNIFSYHHRVPFRKDIVDVMRKCGEIPSSELQDYVKVIQRAK